MTLVDSSYHNANGSHFGHRSGIVLPLFDLLVNHGHSISHASFLIAKNAREELCGEGATNEKDFHKGLTGASYRIPLGTFTPEELKRFGKLEIKIGHVKDGQFVE